MNAGRQLPHRTAEDGQRTDERVQGNLQNREAGEARMTGQRSRRTWSRPAASPTLRLVKDVPDDLRPVTPTRNPHGDKRG